MTPEEIRAAKDQRDARARVVQLVSLGLMCTLIGFEFGYPGRTMPWWWFIAMLFCFLSGTACSLVQGDYFERFRRE